MGINEFLSWLAMSGGGAIAASWIAEQIPAFQSLTAKAKQWIMFAASVVLAVGAYAILTYVPPEVLNALAPYFLIVAGVFGTFFVNQIAHVNDPNRK